MKTVAAQGGPASRCQRTALERSAAPSGYIARVWHHLAMPQMLASTDDVALWTGLLSSAVSIVLSVVAIAFTWAVNQRSEAVTHQTTKSLQDIQGTVHRMSQDTEGLIKVAWDRMVGTMQTPTPNEDAIVARVEGLLAQFRQDANEMGREDVGDLVRNMEHRVRAVAVPARTDQIVGTFQRVYDTVRSLSPAAREILRIISDRGRHLTRRQHKELAARFGAPWPGALGELEEAQMLVPLAAADDTYVYFLPGDTMPYISAALQSAQDDDLDGARTEMLRSSLAAVGYLP
jgi:membrane protein implicated in regulation of membrane protease activity